jgi:hypothetical protein
VARGWELDDRRVSEPRLFSVDQADRAAAGRIRRLSHPEAHPSTPLPLDGGPLYALPSDYETPPAAPLAPMPTGTVMPTTGPAAPESAANAPRRSSENAAPSNRTNPKSPNYPFDHPGLDDSRRGDGFDRPNRDDGSSQLVPGPDSSRLVPGPDANDGGGSAAPNAPVEPKTETPPRPASARPKRRSHTDGNTPLLTRAFDAAASRVRPSSTMSSLIPQTPPLPEPPSPSSSPNGWPAVRFS